ncbi:3' terminal RNA ribose 2'-O-methyltransferase Hen1 [Nannocystis pusilla]|uniref:3' terminal RNA ribose 2'-O-methyltransferase Hen1 n=1 Tax=Nannocystis pusilla TaxID=889268 RepID=UPI003DA367D6
MLLTIRNTQAPADELGWLLHKHPERVQSFEVSFGQVHVFYPEVSEAACTAALLLDIDPVRLVRGGSEQAEGLLAQYVNDRPYAASSFMSVAIAQVLRSALTGQAKARPELVDKPLALTAALPVLACRGGEGLLRALFEPLGYEVRAELLASADEDAAWGRTPYFAVELRRTAPLRELLTHLYVLIPVLDDDKHYYIGDDEVEKLLRFGEGWLAGHPERESIARRYLKHRASLTRRALERLAEGEADAAAEEAALASRDRAEEALERPLSLDEERMRAVTEVLVDSGAAQVLDLGCGSGKLLARLLKLRQFTRVVGVDVAHTVLERAAQRLHLEDMSERTRDRVALLHGSLVYRDARLDGFDAAAAVEVIEHVEPSRLPSFERALFAGARPRVVVITTPNAEYNAKFAGLAAGQLRHADHRFEWTRAEFAAWAGAVGERHGYAVELRPVGPVDPELGAPTQMGVFRR